MTLMSRVLGFVRDTIFAQVFGATAGVDAFYVAFKIPNFMRNLFAEGCFSQAFVPTLSEYRETRSEEETKLFARRVMGTLGIVLLGITIIGVIGAPVLVSIFAPGFKMGVSRFDMATEMLRVTFPYLMLISLTAYAGAVLNNHGKFAAPAFTPVLLNVCMIAAALWLSPYFHIPVKAQAWSILIAGFVQFGFQLPFLKKVGYLLKPEVKWRDPGVQKVLKLMLPSLFGASIGQLSLLINTVFASFLTIGSVSWLYYSERLAYFPLGVFGVALATVVLPHLSKKHALKSNKEFSEALDWGIRWNLIVGIPATIALVLIAGPLITTLFGYGKFTNHDIFMTRQSVIAYAVGLLAFMLVKMLSAGFYARQDVKTPVRIGVISIAVNMILNCLLVFPFAHAGLALAASLSSWLNVGLLLRGLFRKNIYQLQAGWGRFLLRLALANGLMAYFLYESSGDLSQWLSWDWRHRFLHLFVLGLGSLSIYFGTLWVSGERFQVLPSTEAEG